MKTEHEQLKEIIDKIWYKIDDELYFYDDIKNYFRDCYWDCRNIDVREIIFNQEFMDLFRQYTHIDVKYWIWLLFNLDNPTLYIYNLLWLWTNKKW